jgi:peroxiredoxin
MSKQRTPVKRPQAPKMRGTQPSKPRFGISRNGYLGLGVVLIVAVLFGASTLVGGSGNAARAAAPLAIGSTAPSFSGTSAITKMPIDSKTLAGKNVLYYFSEGAGCQACMVQIQALQQHIAHLKNLHLTLVSITNDDPAILFQAAGGYKISTPLVSDADRSMTKRFHALGGGMHADTASHTFILVDKAGTVRFNRDFPNMWADPNALLKLLPKLS